MWIFLTVFSFLPGCVFSQLPLQNSVPIWSPANVSGARFVLTRSPEFVLPMPTARMTSAILFVTAMQSPNVAGGGNTQSKLLGAFRVSVNGVMITAGPGHNVPSSRQAVTTVDVLHLLRDPPLANVVAFSSFFQRSWNGVTDEGAVPRLQCELVASSETVLLSTAPSTWSTLVADDYFVPTGDCTRHSSWYHVPNEDLNAVNRPLGWETPGYVLTPGWAPAVIQPPFPLPFYVEASPAPLILRRSACSVTTFTSGAQLIDFGQQMSGGVNLSFSAHAGAFPEGTMVTVKLGEELLPSGELRVPCRSFVNYTAVFTLDRSSSPKNVGLMTHGFTQFRWAQVEGSPVALTVDTSAAWVLQHPLAGVTAVSNPFEIACAQSRPVDEGRSAAPGAVSGPGWFVSSDTSLNSVFNMTAYTAVGAAIDVNVDSQTRQRDLCHIDALITAQEQFAVFPGGDYELQRRTIRFAFTNDSSIWSSSFEFKASTALMAYLDALETGDMTIANSVWSDRNGGFNADNGTDYVSVQFMAGVRYFNTSGNGLLHIPSETSDPTTNCGGGGIFGCNALIDWPVQTRDGYVVTSDDAIRNGMGTAAISALATLAAWRGDTPSAAQYRSMSRSIRNAMVAKMLHCANGSGECYFVDGVATTHAAIHSTIYAISAAGVLDFEPGETPPANVGHLACGFAAYLARRDTGGSSCMTARWLVDALYRIGVLCDAAADAALSFLRREEYPSWRFMMTHANATMTLEAWAPDDKWNTDFSHPWCASPAFLIPRMLMGVRPIERGWTVFRVAPQPGVLMEVRVSVPTPLGAVNVTFSQKSVVKLSIEVPVGSSAQVCLPPLHASLGGRSSVSQDVLTVDGIVVAAPLVWGRLLCTTKGSVNAGVHKVTRS